QYGRRRDPISIAAGLLELTWNEGCKRTVAEIRCKAFGKIVAGSVLANQLSLMSVVSKTEELAKDQIEAEKVPHFKEPVPQLIIRVKVSANKKHKRQDNHKYEECTSTVVETSMQSKGKGGTIAKTGG
ncbi:hypothetical protein Tco_1330887, partial [Tanacetum coccineum]